MTGMRGSCLYLLICTSLFLITFELVSCRRVIRAAPDAEKTGCYMIRLEQSLTSEEFEQVKHEIVKYSKELLYEENDDLLKVVTVKVDESKVDKIKNIEGVEYLEEETLAHGSSYLPWNLDQLDQCSTIFDDLYAYHPIGDGEGVDIYILDTGIRYTHKEFEGRANYSGKDPIDDNYGTNQKGLDCNGHGTHVASLAAGKMFGAAKKANLYSVRVLDCNNTGPWSVIINGLIHVANRAYETGRPSIISMSLYGGYSFTVDYVVSIIALRNIPIIVCAGNARSDSCNFSPASNSLAVTVGASRSDSLTMYWSNVGSCVDIFAPGEDVLGADMRCDTCKMYLSGCSMATPLVAGIAAIQLQRQPLLTPTQLKQKLVDESCKNILNYYYIPDEFKASTPNRLLHITGNCGGEYSVGSTGTEEIISPAFPSNYTNSVECIYKLKTTNCEKILRLTLDEFDTYNSSDYLEIIDGDYDDQGVLIARISGEIPSTRVYNSTKNSMTLRFVTDCCNTKKGFKAHFDSQPGIAVSTTPTTIDITSPNTVTMTKNLITTITSTSTVTFFPSTTSLVPTRTSTTTSVSISTSTTTSTVEILVTSLKSESITATCFQPSMSSTPTTSTVSIPMPTDLPSTPGLHQTNPAESCAYISAVNSSATSGYYWIQLDNQTVISVFCELEVDKLKGMMRIANIDMTKPASKCPEGLRLINTRGSRLCGRNITDGCSSTFFNVSGMTYSKVCGKLHGYQFASTKAFYWNSIGDNLTIDDVYVDGVVLSYSEGNKRNHIWTFASALDEMDYEGEPYACQCTNGNDSLVELEIPEFVGEDYFCETGVTTNYYRLHSDNMYLNDPLWDGEGCGQNNTCCDRGSLFCKEIIGATTAPIELRLCGRASFMDGGDTPLEKIELYVQ